MSHMVIYSYKYLTQNMRLISLNIYQGNLFLFIDTPPNLEQKLIKKINSFIKLSI